MKKHIPVTFLFFAILLTSCGSFQRDSSNSIEYIQMLEKVQDLEFEIENEWANPMKYRRVNLLGNPNHIKFEGDSVKVYLPFFGERQFGGGYGSDEGAIQYEGPLKDLRIEERPRKNQIRIFFEGSNDSENLDFSVIVFPNGKTTTLVNSSQRDQINYEGKIKKQELE
ncbi:DUF4251 domain-containing protein [Salinimicrobium terrae]|uniref:DUF4251 domain-containing protein n=1 Tax=Salinimicrobium terrae TaxID=470866 RepID=UPI00068430FC|nr:DUF4251 domain-containing protein [Salinimicrobium terrae]